jgi:polyisoprenoid-binding protein YceI
VLVSLTDASRARYRVREQLARRNLPNDAVGVTERVSGEIAFNADGTIDSSRSKVTVNLASLVSDDRRRDNYIRNNTLETPRFPDAELVVLEAPLLPWPLPESGPIEFQLVGDTTIHGVTKPLTWDVTAEFEGGRVAGVAKTSFTFDTFGMRVPRVFIVLSVEDNIRLELEFDAVIAAGE